MYPIDSGLYCPKRSQLFIVFWVHVSYLSWMNRLMSLIKFRRKIGHWNPEGKLRKEDTRKHLFFGESSWCWISNFSSSCFSTQHFLSRQDPDHWICWGRNGMPVWQVYSLFCLPELVQLESFLLSKEWLSYLKK